MRYSVFEFSQERLLDCGLDVTDALILSWFTNFFAGKMEKRIFRASESDSAPAAVYGWVRTSKIMEDLPVIGISSEKGVRKRLDGLVAKGVLERRNVVTHGGRRSYYRTTDIFDSLINTRAGAASEREREEEVSGCGESRQRNSGTSAEAESRQGFAKELQYLCAKELQYLCAKELQFPCFK